MVGTRVSHYDITEALGAGGMGAVYEAEDTQLGRRVALKFLPEALCSDPVALERFQREARAASALNHPNICTVYAIEQWEDRHFIAMERLEGETLAAGLRRSGHVDAARLVDLGSQIADALESAHAKGIVHRDIKPANIFVNGRGQVKLLDFGLAKFATGAELTAGAEAATRRDLTTPGTAMGTVSYMSPEQARGELTDVRTDLFSLGTVLYELATGAVPFKGDTSAVVFEAIFNLVPVPVTELNPAMPDALARLIGKALEKDRRLRYQSATDLRTDLLRIRRDMDSDMRAARPAADTPSGATRAAERSVAVLFFENLSGVKEDEYFRDGITEDIITELSKIRGLNTFSRPTVLAFRDKPVTPAQIGQQLGATCVLAGSLRRAGNRLRINTQLIDTRTDFPLWSERYDREMKDIFDVQDEIARKIAEALRITLSPQEQAALSQKPTDNPQAYDLYLRGRSYARRQTYKDLQLALQFFENAVALDPNFALAYAGIANVLAQDHYLHATDTPWADRARAALEKAVSLQPDLAEAHVAQGWFFYINGEHERAVAEASIAIRHKPDCEGVYYMLGRALFVMGRLQEIVDMADTAIAANGADYNIYIPILNALTALGKTEEAHNLSIRRVETLEIHLSDVPDDARARMQLAVGYAVINRFDDASREANLAMLLRPNEPTVLYNAACTFCLMNRKREALDAMKKAWKAGFKDAVWARRDADLALLHDDPEFQALYPG